MEKDEYLETAKFCSMFDCFFDCLNSRNLIEGKTKRKPDLDPYTSADDARFKVCLFLVFGCWLVIFLCN